MKCSSSLSVQQKTWLPNVFDIPVKWSVASTLGSGQALQGHFWLFWEHCTQIAFFFLFILFLFFPSHSAENLIRYFGPVFHCQGSMCDFSKQSRKPKLLPVSPSSLHWALHPAWGVFGRHRDPQSSALVCCSCLALLFLGISPWLMD